MGYDDEYALPDDETLKKENYEEYTLSDVDEKNLGEIEFDLKKKKINTSNKKDILDYLQKLRSQINTIAKEEYKFEGAQNPNINKYLKRIEILNSEIEKII